MLKSIGYFLAFIWIMLFITGEPTVMEITIGAFFVILVIGTFVFDRKDKH